MAEGSNFKKYVLPSLITAIAGILMVLLTHWLSKDEVKLSTKETTETRAPDGTVTRRQMEIYR